ncbi:MAG: leucine--tRNA ligase [Nanoarchaeota archaeon]
MKKNMKKTGYDFKKIEEKWQKQWEKKKIFRVKEDKRKKKFYVLDMFPYPSGEGLHMGHAFVFSLGDIFSRFKRLQGFNVLYPIGYDSFGLPAENAAIKNKEHPKIYTDRAIRNFALQQRAMGWSYDWNRSLRTSDPDYYRWDQWIILQMLKNGMVYRKKAPVNYCRKCDTVLANEQVENGKCWRHNDAAVEIRHLEQWFFRTTSYAEELLLGLEKIDWPENAKKLQRNWIGKSYGTEILFEINNEKWPIFTTRPDTIFGVTFMVMSAQHSRLMEMVTDRQKKEVEQFLKKIKSVSEKERDTVEKEGVFTGSYAKNPMTGEKVPIYAGNFVVADYGSGMVMAVPGHDQRDFEFAKKYNLPIKVVIKPENYEMPEDTEKIAEAYEGEGITLNSGMFTDLKSKEATEKIIKYLIKKKMGKKMVQYKLRDWLISRQRYWGTPIPIVYCDKCGIVPVPEKEIPVLLPEKVKFGRGNPLETNEDFVNAKCPKCKSNARRETDTMDTFVNSSWYYLRYTDPKNNKKIFDSKKANYWTPIDQYIGGPEHITAHLIYIRFYTKFLNKLGIINFDEPALRYFTQGIVHGSDGEKMSKSRGNIIEPLETIKKYGADTLRITLVSFASADKDTNWDEKVVIGNHKFLNQIYGYFSRLKFRKKDERVESYLQKTIKEVTKDIGNFKHNLAVIKIRKLFQHISETEIDRSIAESFLKLLHPYCPFITEELWAKLGNKNFISIAEWPEADESKINLEFEKEEEIVEKVINDINNVVRIIKDKGKEAGKLYLYAVPNEKNVYNNNSNEIEKRTGLKVEVFAVNDKNKYDPDKKSSKAKPGKPGIYLE